MKLCIRGHDLGVTGIGPIREKLTAYGLDGVQLVTYKSCPEVAYAPGAITRQRAAEIREALAGFDIPLLGAYFNPVHPDPAKRENGFAVFADYLQAASAFGSPVVASETGSLNGDEWTYHPGNRTEASLGAVVDTFARLCDIGADAGACVAMEGVADHVCWNIETLDLAQRRIGRKNLKVIFDLCNYLEGPEQRDYLAVLDRGLDVFAGRIHAFHMKDCRFTGGRRPQGVPLGTGELDMRAILKRIKAYDPGAVLVLEETTEPYIASAASLIRTVWEEV